MKIMPIAFLLFLFGEVGICQNNLPDSLIRDYYKLECKIGFHFLDDDTVYNHVSAYGWGDTYFLQADLIAYKVTHDTTLLSHFVHVANIVLAHRDDFIDFADWKGIVSPGWSTGRRYVPKLGKGINDGPPMHDLVEDANIVYPYIEFYQVVSADSTKVRGYISKAQYYLGEAEKVIDYHITNDWDANQQRFTFPKGSPIWCDGVNVPNNYEAGVGEDLILLYNIEHSAKYLAILTSIAQHLKQSLSMVNNDEYVWHYWSGKGGQGWTARDNISTNTPNHDPQLGIEDINHGGVDMSFVVDCYQNGIVFGQSDMQRFTNIFMGVIDKKTFLAHDLNGKGGAPNDARYYLSALSGWLRLCQFDKRIYWAFYSIFYQIPKPYLDIHRLFLLASLMQHWPLGN